MARNHIKSVRKYGILGILLSVAGCGADNLAPNATIGSSLWSIELNAHAVTLSALPPHNTIQLRVTPRDTTGALIESALPPQFTVVGDTGVKVNSTGLVTAHVATNIPIAVIVTQSMGNVTQTDSVLVSVTDGVASQQIATLALYDANDPEGPSGIRQLYTDVGMDVVWKARDATQAMIPNIPIVLQTSDASIADVLEIDREHWQIRPKRAGPVTITATAVVYGVTKQNAQPVVIKDAHSYNIGIEEYTPRDSRTPRILFRPKNNTVSQGATIMFLSALAHSVDVVFDNPASVDACVMTEFLCFITAINSGDTGSGNIATIRPLTGEVEGRAARQLSRAGVYRFYSRLYPSDTGVVVVR